MALVVRCSRCEKDHEMDEAGLANSHIDCPFCNVSAAKENFSSIMFCPHCYAELHVPLDVIHKELECPYCDKTFRSNVSFSLSANEDETEAEMNEIIGEHSETLLSPGDVFDKYKIIRLLGKGGMGEVYLAQHMLLNREIALKILNSNAAASNQIYAKRFVREAKLANRIDSENFISVFDAGIEVRTGSLFIAMEYINGQNLTEIMSEKGTFSETEILQIALSVANVLMILERENIVHRDIKPSNIMINSDGVVKLADFGIAKSENSDENDLTLTQGNLVFGTPNYASPEQCRSSHNVDFRADIYSLGATMFHMAAGEPPYNGTTAMETVIKVLNEEPRSLKDLTQGFSAGFILLVDDMIKHDPDKRPQSAEALKIRIELLLRGKQSFMVQLKYACKILASKLSLWSSELWDFSKKTFKKIPKKGLKRFAKTVGIILLLFCCVMLTLRHRSKFVQGFDFCKNAVRKFTKTEQKTPVKANSKKTAPPKEEKTKIKTAVPVRENAPEQKAIATKQQPVSKTISSTKKIEKTAKTAKQKKTKIAKPVVKKNTSKIYHDKLRKAIFSRLEKCNRELKQTIAEKSSYADPAFYADKVKFYKKLQKNLLTQLKERERAFIVKSGKGFNSDISASIAALVREYSKSEHHEPFSPEDKIFAQQLLHYVKNPAGDPNVLISDVRHPKFSGPLLRWIEHANMPLKKEIEKELMIHHVSADCISGICSIELCKYGIINMSGLLNLNIKKQKFNDAATLIEYGANVNEFDETGRTPLHWAVLYNNMDIVRKLLLAGADFNIRDKKEKQTPLFYAEKYASGEIKELLLTLGADEYIEDIHNQTYQHYAYVREFNDAVKKNNSQQILLLLNGHPELSNMEMSGGLLPLQYACINNNADTVIELLKNKADPNAVSTVCPYTPLQLAYEYPENRKQSDAVRLARWGIFTSLLQKGANAAVPPVGHNYPTLLQFSLSNTADLDDRHMFFISSLIRNYDTSAELPVILAGMYQHTDPIYRNDQNSSRRKRILAQLLLQKPNLNQDKFESLLPLTAWSPKITEEEIDSLLKYGARINGKDKYGRNALYILCTYIAQNQSYIDSRSMQLQMSRIRYLIKKGIDKKCKVNMISIEDMELPELIMPLLK